MRKIAFLIVAIVALAIAGGLFVLHGRSDEQYPAASTTAPATAPAAAVATDSPSPADVKALFKAVDSNNIARVTEMLHAQPALISTRGGKHHEMALHHAPTVEMANLLLSAGADAQGVDGEYGARSVRWALSSFHDDVADLLEGLAGADNDIAYDIAAGNKAKVKERLAVGEKADGKAEGNDVLGANEPLIQLAAIYNRPDTAELLLASGADANAPGDWSHAPPLEYAAWYGQTDVVRILLKHGADVNHVIQSPQGAHTALWWAALTGRAEIVKMLLAAGATVEPVLPDAVEQAKTKPYPGRDLPKADAYDAVVTMLRAAAATQPAAAK